MKLQKIKNKVIDKVSDIMSYPARRNAQKSILKSEKEFTRLKAINVSNKASKLSKQQEALKNFKPPNMKGFKYGAGTGM